MKKYYIYALLLLLVQQMNVFGMYSANPMYTYLEDKKEQDKADAQEAERQLWYDEQLQDLNRKKQEREQELNRLVEIKKRQEKEARRQFKKEHGYLKKEEVEHVIKHAPQEIKKILQSFSNSKKINDEFTRNKIIKSHIMLEGPAGTGKSSIAMAMAQKIGRPVYLIEASMLSTKYKDSGAENLKDAIENAIKQHGQVTVILEELPVLVDTRKDAQRSDTDPGATLWRLMDRYKNDKRVIFIATANNIERLPEPLKSRFDKATIHIDLPSEELKVAALKYQLGKYSDDALIKEIAKNTPNFSYRNIEDLTERMIDYMVEHNKQKMSFDECKNLIKGTRLLKEEKKPWFRGCNVPWSEKTTGDMIACTGKDIIYYSWLAADTAIKVHNFFYGKDDKDKKHDDQKHNEQQNHQGIKKIIVED